MFFTVVVWLSYFQHMVLREAGVGLRTMELRQWIVCPQCTLHFFSLSLGMLQQNKTVTFRSLKKKIIFISNKDSIMKMCLESLLQYQDVLCFQIPYRKILKDGVLLIFSSEKEEKREKLMKLFIVLPGNFARRPLVYLLVY